MEKKSNNPIDNFNMKDAINMIATIKDQEKRLQAVNGTINIIAMKHSKGMPKVPKNALNGFIEDLETFKFAVDSRFNDVKLPDDVIFSICKNVVESDEPNNECIGDDLLDDDGKPIFKGKLITPNFR